MMQFNRLSTSLVLLVAGRVAQAETRPAAVGPVPTQAQLAWQNNEFGLYLRFGISTFTGDENGTGKEPASVFQPRRLDAAQWIAVANASGARRVVLTVKGHEGFCLWPTRTTDYSVKSSPWKEGGGDVLREFADACHHAGLGMGVYLSVEDRHEATYGKAAYNAFYQRQLEEVLTGYGEISEVRFDGAGGEGAKAAPDVAADPQKAACDWKGYFATVRRLQPGAIIVSNVGPDARWNGNNIGHAGEPNWSTFTPEALPGPELTQKKQLSLLNMGNPAGQTWCPAECLVPIGSTWFWHPEEASHLQTVDKLFTAYCKSVGRNCSLLLNVPVDADGEIAAEDAGRLKELHEKVTAAFAHDLAAGKPVRASGVRGNDSTFGPEMAVDEQPNTFWATDDASTDGSWIEVDLGGPTLFDTVEIAEEIRLGQRVETYRIEVPAAEGSRVLVHGKGIGRRKIERFAPTTASRLRLVIESTKACPTISALKIFSVQPHAAK